MTSGVVVLAVVFAVGLVVAGGLGSSSVRLAAGRLQCASVARSATRLPSSAGHAGIRRPRYVLLPFVCERRSARSQQPSRAGLKSP